MGEFWYYSLKIIFFCNPELSWWSRHGERVNITPKMHRSMAICVVNFWHGTKNSTNWCAQQSWGIPRKMADRIFLTLYFLLKLNISLYKVLSDNLENKLAKVQYTWNIRNLPLNVDTLMLTKQFSFVGLSKYIVGSYQEIEGLMLKGNAVR